METAIKKAIEGGYEVERGYAVEKTVGNRDRFALLDPLFWQALGKVCRWEKHAAFEMGYDHCWICNWHHFIDALVEGKSPDEFFNQLLS